MLSHHQGLLSRSPVKDPALAGSGFLRQDVVDRVPTFGVPPNCMAVHDGAGVRVAMGRQPALTEAIELDSKSFPQLLRGRHAELFHQSHAIEAHPVLYDLALAKAVGDSERHVHFLTGGGNA